jgi:hypothetical protein
MNTDPRGVKRGICQSDNCDCSSYEFDEKNGAKCNYCFCPPTKHRVLGNYIYNYKVKIADLCEICK